MSGSRTFPVHVRVSELPPIPPFLSERAVLAFPRYADLVQQWVYLERVFSERVIRRKRECDVRLTTKGRMVQIPYVGAPLILLTPLYECVNLYLRPDH